MAQLSWTTLSAAAVLGLMGAGHCISMCGGIVAALGAGGKGHTLGLNLVYSAGRIASYALMGALAGAAVYSMPVSGWPLARTLAGVVLILMGFYITGWWRVLVQLERAGALVWRGIKPLAARLMPVRSVPAALAAGMVWGWLPCGLVYSALAYAAAQGDAPGGAAVMAAFGVGTLPALVFGGAAISRLRLWLNQRWVKRALGVAYMLFGIWTIAAAWYHAGHHHDHAAQPMDDNPQMQEASDEAHHHHHH